MPIMNLTRHRHSDPRPGFSLRGGFRVAGIILLCAIFVFRAFGAGEKPELREIILLHTNDLHFDYNYLDSVKEKIAKFRNRYANVFLMDAGDFSSRPPREEHVEGMAEYEQNLRRMMAILNDLGYVVATPGNHELGYRRTLTRDAMRSARFPFLGANVTVETENFVPLKPYIHLETGDGLRLAVIGVTGGNYGNAEGITLTDPLEAIEAHRNLREGAHAIVLLTHIGYGADRQLAERLGDFADVILGGHSHTQVNPPEISNGVLIAQTGGHLHAMDPARRQLLGVVRLRFDPDGKLVEKSGEVLRFDADGASPSRFLDETP